jgi:hypothetical protein
MMRATLGFVLLAAACGGGGSLQATEPLRPKATAVGPKEEPVVAGPTDCQAIAASEGSPWVPYRNRRIPEGEALASQGLEALIRAEKPGSAEDKAALITLSVRKFHDTLAIDPYNVKATYNLAAAYGRIGRKQCSLNMLARLVEMASFPSQREAVGDAADRLFGRGKWKGRPDPDFDGMRADPEFGAIVKKF